MLLKTQIKQIGLIVLLKDLVAGFTFGSFMDDYIPMKIYGILPERVIQAADVSYDPSVIQLPPAATFRADQFAQYMATLETFGMTGNTELTLTLTLTSCVNRNLAMLLLACCSYSYYS